MDEPEERKLATNLEALVTKYEHICRLCLTPIDYGLNDVSSGLSVFTKNENAVPYNEMIMHLINMQILENDFLPKKLCRECSSQLLSFYKFKKSCEDNMKVLNNLFYGNVTETGTDIKQEFDIDCSDVCVAIVHQNESYKTEKYAEQQNNLDVDQYDDSSSTDDDMSDVPDAIGDKDEKPRKKNKARSAKQSNRSETKKKPSVKHRKVCEECGLTFSTNCTLRRHRITHTGRKDFCCDICNNRFARKFHLDMHMRIHLKIRPHICETCASSFSTSSDLTRHRRIHVDVKNYACVVCQRRFKRSSDVIKHMRTHTGQKPYSCKECDKNYSSHSGLAKHLRRHHPKRPGDADDSCEKMAKHCAE